MTLCEKETIVAGPKFDAKKMRGGAKVSKGKVFAERLYKSIDLSRRWSKD